MRLICLGEYQKACRTHVLLMLVIILLGEAFLPIYIAHWIVVNSILGRRRQSDRYFWFIYSIIREICFESKDKQVFGHIYQ